MRVRSEGGGRKRKLPLKVGDEVLVVWGLDGVAPLARRGRIYSIYDSMVTHLSVYRILLNRPAHGAKLHTIPPNCYEEPWKAHCEKCPHAHEWMAESR